MTKLPLAVMRHFYFCVASLIRTMLITLFRCYCLHQVPTRLNCTYMYSFVYFCIRDRILLFKTKILHAAFVDKPHIAAFSARLMPKIDQCASIGWFEMLHSLALRQSSYRCWTHSVRMCTSKTWWRLIRRADMTFPVTWRLVTRQHSLHYDETQFLAI